MGYLLALLASAFWGMTYVLDERVLEEMSSVKLYFMHCLVGLCFSCLAWFLSGGEAAQLISLPTNSSTRKILFGSMVIGYLAGMSIVSSIGMLGASRSAILEISYPLFVIIFSYFLFARGVSLQVIAGGVLIFIGSAIIVLSEDDTKMADIEGKTSESLRPSPISEKAGEHGIGGSALETAAASD